jgi:hypothetical protein
VPVLTVYKAKQTGRISGGFTFAGYTRNGGYKSDPKAFIWRFFNGKVEVAVSKSDSYSSYSHDSYGPTFGGGHDYYIPNSCNTNQGYTNTGYSYALPSGVNYGTT